MQSDQPNTTDGASIIGDWLILKQTRLTGDQHGDRPPPQPRKFRRNAEIRKAFAAHPKRGMIKKLAEMFGLSQQRVSQIIYGQNAGPSIKVQG